jgi:predicted TIM-barrel fold metal-dependent hydrolase
VRSRKGWHAAQGPFFLSRRYAKMTTQAAERIDVHHHILPSEFVSQLEAKGVEKGLGVRFPKWDADKSLAFMKKYGISTAIASIAIPEGVEDEVLLRELTRWCNDYLAGLKRDFPERFGAFAALPLPDVEAALSELRYALDELRLDGVGLFSHYSEKYLGNNHFESVFEELNKRKAVVFVHPIDPPEEYDSGLQMPGAIVEAPFETTRTVANLIFTGVADRYPDIRYILAHGGGAIPYLAWRISLIRYLQENKRPAVIRAYYDFLVKRGPHTGLEWMRKMYYDTALTTSPPALRALQEFVGPSKIVFGTDFPFAAHLAPFVVGDLERYDGFSEQEFAAINYLNARELFPRVGRR